jgi:hypothetical protein
MKLPGNAVGPTDIQTYRDCPRRFAFGMRRHTEAGEHPEAQSLSTAYGSAVHRALEIVERSDASDADAVQAAFDEFAKWLDPADLERLRNDLRTYHERDYLGVRTVAVETELQVPLFEHEGTMIHLRTRIDRLYQRLDNPGIFVHVDYKSSRWPKSQKEVDEDRQLWLTNLIVHEVYPECDVLVQAYDQLNFGVLTTRKTEQQRRLVGDWAIHQVTAILGDDELPAKKNRWCPWCPIMESCPVVAELTDYARAEIAELAPAEKVGRKTVLNLEPDLYEVYVEALEDVNLAQKVLRRFDESVRGVIKEMPDARQRELGFETKGRSKTTWPPEALKAAHEVLGEDFYEVVGLTKTAVERLGDERADIVMDMAIIEDGAPVVLQRR